jgi:hypothetical protein
MALKDTLKNILGSAWHVASDAFFDALTPAADGTVEASKPVVADANKDVTGLRNVTMTGTLTQGSGAEAAAVKGEFLSAAIAVAVPAITDPDIAKVDVDVSAMTFAPAVGDAVLAIPQEAMETNARILGAYVISTDTVRVVFGSEGGNVTGGNKNFKFLFKDLT